MKNLLFLPLFCVAFGCTQQYYTRTTECKETITKFPIEKVPMVASSLSDIHAAQSKQAAKIDTVTKVDTLLVRQAEN